MRILDLPHFSKYAGNKYAKILRHKAKTTEEFKLWDLVSTGNFEKFQDSQSWDVFGDAQVILSFIAERHKYAKFVGVWEVIGKKPKRGQKGFIYQTKKIQGFENLEARLIVKWGDGTRSWAQWLHTKGNKEINELLPPYYVMDFPGFYDFKLSYAQLKQMIDNPDSNREWYRMLSSISGVYIILDLKSGKQYVGSAYGKGGIWRRWKSYRKNPSGGNVLITTILEKDPERFNHFQFSILRVLEPGSMKEQVIAQESLIKEKLGSRAFGLNIN